MPGGNLNQLTEAIIGCAFAVSNTLDAGFLEKVYGNAMVVALRKASLKASRQVRYEILYEGEIMGEYIADLVVDRQVLVELKTVREFDSVHTAICLNYLKASNQSLCPLMNFGKPRVDAKRIAL